jgi:hypothetical protein
MKYDLLIWASISKSFNSSNHQPSQYSAVLSREMHSEAEALEEFNELEHPVTSYGHGLFASGV